MLRRNWFNVSDAIECSEKFVWRKEARNTKVLLVANTSDERGRSFPSPVAKSQILLEIRCKKRDMVLVANPSENSKLI